MADACTLSCRQCKSKIHPDSRFCEFCGKKVSKFCSKCGLADCSCESVINLQRFREEKNQQRASHLDKASTAKKPKKATKKVTLQGKQMVNIKVGRIERDENGCLKKQRGNWAVLELNKACNADTIQEEALKKHASLDQYFCPTEEHVLLYPDDKIVQFIPSTEEKFTLEKYKKFLQQPYNKICLFLCSEIDFLADVIDDKNPPNFRKKTEVEVDSDSGLTDDDKKFVTHRPKKVLVVPESDIEVDSDSGLTDDDKKLVTLKPKKVVVVPEKDIVMVNADMNILNNNENRNNTKTYPCPTCQKLFSLIDIETHADECAAANAPFILIDDNYEEDDKANKDSNTDQTDKKAESRLNLTDPEAVRLAIKTQVEDVGVKDNTKKVNLIVFRGTAFKDFHKHFKKSWNPREASKLTIKFAGEDGKDDGGGVSREFYTDALNEVKQSYFCGSPEEMEPLDSAYPVADGTITSIGHLFAASICNNGPAPNFLAPWVFDYVASGIKTLPEELKCESKMALIYNKLYKATTLETIRKDLSSDEGYDVLQYIGYRGLPSSVTLDDKEELLRTILLKKMEPHISFMEHLKQGLDVYKLLDPIRQNPEIFKQIFCHSDVLLWSYEMFTNNLKVVFSEDGSNQKAKELQNYRIFLEMCESSYYNENAPVKLGSIIKFVTGADTIPPCGVPKLELKFKHTCNDECRCLPESMTCSSTLILPLHYESADIMYERFSDALKHVKHYGFGKE